MTDVEDVAELLSNFGQHSGVEVAVALSVAGAGKRRTLAMTMTAWELFREDAEPVLLASVSATCLDMQVRSLGAALTRLVYLTDGALASRERALAGNYRA